MCVPYVIEYIPREAKVRKGVDRHGNQYHLVWTIIRKDCSVKNNTPDRAITFILI